MPPTSQFFQVPASGKFERLESVREHRQCLLFFTEKVPILHGKGSSLFRHCGKNYKFFQAMPP